MAPSPDPSPAPEAPKSLTQRFVATWVWSGLQMFVMMVLRLGSNLILTRLLLPDAFGLMAFGMVIMTAVTQLADIGVWVNIMRDKDGEKPYFLRAVWTVNVIRGAMISAAMLVIAFLGLPIIRQFVEPDTVLAAPEAVGVTAIMAFGALFTNLGSTNEFLAMRRLDVKRLAFLAITGSVIGLTILLPTVYFFPNVWALVIVLTINLGLRSLLTHLFLPGPRMAWVWDPEITQRVWKFGKWIMASSAFNFLGNQGERVIFSAMLDVTTFGIYAIARLWAEAAQQVFQTAMNSSGTSAISEIIRKKDRPLERPFQRLQLGVDVLVVAGVGLFYLLIGPFIRLVYNDNFVAAADIAPLLSLLALRLRFNTFGVVLLASGQSQSQAMVALQQAIATLILVWGAMTAFTFEVAVTAYACAGLAGVPYTMIKAKSYLPNRNMAIDWAWFAIAVAVGVFTCWVQLDQPAPLPT